MVEVGDYRKTVIAELLILLLDEAEWHFAKDLELVRHSVENGCGKDAPGNLAHYMVEHTTMHAWPMTAGRFDIGSLDTYYEACDLARAGKI